MDKLIGRKEEKELLLEIEKSGEPELVAVYGRRRVGKTFLIYTVFNEKLAFEFSGVHHATLKEQLESFSLTLTRASNSLPLARPGSWMEAFSMLIDYLTPVIKKQRKVIFFDEFPWINTPRSGFLRAFENFWNTWASRQSNLIVVICGSAAAWMIQKVINNRGGLHNRVTRRIRLVPFTLGETAEFLNARKVNLNHYQILYLYMVMGGIPQYLKEVKAGESAVQAIDRICFTKDGLLHSEFKNLYYSLFDNAGPYMDIIRALSKKGAGLTRNEIIKSSNLTSGGRTTRMLDELSESGFISPYIPFNRTSKDSIFKLTDEYSRFYLKFIENSRSRGKGGWVNFSAGASWKSWSGIAFENICMNHAHQLKRALGIENVHTEISVWHSRPQNGEKGAQIDLLIDRQDQCVNICEMKFSIGDFEITKAYAAELENKLNTFRRQTRSRKTLFLTMVTTFGIKNLHKYTALVQQEVTMDALFH